MESYEIYRKLEDKVAEKNMYENEYMSKHTSFQIGGVADIFIKSNSIEEIQNIVKVANKYKIPLKIMGNGTNILVNDKGVRGIVLKVELNQCEIVKDINDPYVIVEAGMSDGKLAQILLKHNISGLEFACGIPGTIGAGIKMNSGAYGEEFKDIVEETTYIDLKDGQIKTIPNSEHKFSYRHSIFSEIDAIILSAKLKLKYGNKEEIERKMQENLDLRQAKQPLNHPSAGSTWKRGEDFITSKIIDECDLKGKAFGGAQVSTKHAGFIINTGDASSKDVTDLIEFIQQKVLEKTGKKIELEIEIW